MRELISVNPVVFSTADHTDTAIICFEPTADQSLAIEQADGEMADDLHVTLALLGPIGDMDRSQVEGPLRDIAKDYGSLSGEISGIGSFGPEGTENLTVGLVQANDLAKFRTDLVQRLADVGVTVDQTYDFIPHVTLSYGPIQDEAAVVGLPLTFDAIYLYWGGKVMSLPLTGDAQTFDDEGETSDSASGPESSDGDEEASVEGDIELAVTGKPGLPIADRDHGWDASGAEKRVSDRSQSGDTFDPSLFDWVAYGDAFMWRDKTKGHDKGGYKLPFADIIDGKLTAIPKGIFAAAGRLSETDMPADDVPGVKARIAGYYKQMRKKFDDPTIKVPWDASIEEEIEMAAPPEEPDTSAGKTAVPTATEDDADAGTDAFHIEANCERCPTGEPFAVISNDDDELMGCHPDNEAAKNQVDALNNQDGVVSEDPDPTDSTGDQNAGEGGSSMSLADLTEDELVAELARRLTVGAAEKIEAALGAEDTETADVEDLEDARVGDPEEDENPNDHPQEGDGSPTGDAQYDWTGVLTVEGLPSGDGRMIADGVLTWRDLPLPLMLKTVTSPGHDGADFCGWIQDIQRVSPDIVGSGTFIDSPAGEQARQILEDPAGSNKFGVSADIDSATAEYIDADTGETIDPSDMLFGDGANVVECLTSGRIMGATMTPFPAFQEAYIEVLGSPADDAVLVASGAEYTGQVWRTHIPGRMVLTGHALPLVASGATVSPINEDLIAPPADWFNLQPMDEPQPFTVDADGRIYGLVAQFGTCHIGFDKKCVDVPRNADFRSFYGGRTVITAEGTVVKAGSIIMDTVHPNLRFNASDAQAFYAHTGSAVADVALHMNEWGIVAAGAVRPDADPIHVRNLRASDISPDWRVVSHMQTLVALLAVNLSGFIVKSLVASGGEIPNLRPRALVDLESGEVLTLVAAGAVRHDRPVTSSIANEMATTNDRITALQAEVDQLKAFVREERARKALDRLGSAPSDIQIARRRARVDAVMATFSGGACAPLTPSATEADCECGGTCDHCQVLEVETSDGFADITQKERDEAVKAGEAMKDGSYPIRNVSDLDKAIRAVGRGKGSHEAIRKHIMKRAKALKATGKIPDNWKSDGTLKDGTD